MQPQPPEPPAAAATGPARDRAPEFRPGDELLIRYIEPGRQVLGAFPVRLVADEGDRLVVWLAAGSEVRYFATPDGGDPRELPLEQRFAQGFTSIRRRWHGASVLRVIPLGECYQVVHFWDEAGSFVGWYVNLESIKHLHGRVVDSTDWQLDLWINAQHVPSWKDEDEAEVAVSAGYLSREELQLARSAGEVIVADIDGWLADLGDWRAWRPPSGWNDPLPLPEDWDDLADEATVA